jgi:hypothetical protein
MRARPIASICCSPPDMVPADWLILSDRRGKSVSTRSMSSWYALLLRSLRTKAPMSRFSRTLMPTKQRRPSGDWLMPSLTRSYGAAWVMSLPSNFTEPARTLRMPERVFSVVVFPAPLAPIRVVTLPSGTLKLMSRMASMCP